MSGELLPQRISDRCVIMLTRMTQFVREMCSYARDGPAFFVWKVISRIVSASALLAILFAFTQTEGCGRRFVRVNGLSFSPSGEVIGVSTANARDAQVSLKFYLGDVARTLSVLSTNDGTSRLVHQTVAPGNQGPMLHDWFRGPESAQISPLSGKFIANEWTGGGVLEFSVDSPDVRVLIDSDEPFQGMSVSRSGRYVASTGQFGTVVADAVSGQAVNRLTVSGNSYRLGGPLLSFSSDESHLVVADSHGIRVWDIVKDSELTSIRCESEVTCLVVTPNDSVVVGTDEGVHQYDLQGNTIKELSNEGCQLSAMSPDGKTIALAGVRHISFINCESEKQVTYWRLHGTSAIAFSPQGDSLAVGTSSGMLRLFDYPSGELRWKCNPPIRDRYPRTGPVLALALWCFISWHIGLIEKWCQEKHTSRGDTHESNGGTWKSRTSITRILIVLVSLAGGLVVGFSVSIAVFLAIVTTLHYATNLEFVTLNLANFVREHMLLGCLVGIISIWF